jgi:hypothetical protein
MQGRHAGDVFIMGCRVGCQFLYFREVGVGSEEGTHGRQACIRGGQKWQAGEAGVGG